MLLIIPQHVPHILELYTILYTAITKAPRLHNGHGPSTWVAEQVFGDRGFCRGIIFNISVLGNATLELTRFKEVIGVDPSETMLTRAKGLLNPSPPVNKITFVQSKAEELDNFEAESIDMVIAGKNISMKKRPFSAQNIISLAQAAHWFDYEKLWPQLARILRKEGTVAFWVSLLFQMTQSVFWTEFFRVIHNFVLMVIRISHR